MTFKTAKVHFRRKTTPDGKRVLFFQGYLPDDFEDLMLSEETGDQLSGVRFLITDIKSQDKTDDWGGFSDELVRQTL